MNIYLKDLFKKSCIYLKTHAIYAILERFI